QGYLVPRQVLEQVVLGLINVVLNGAPGIDPVLQPSPAGGDAQRVGLGLELAQGLRRVPAQGGRAVCGVIVDAQAVGLCNGQGAQRQVQVVVLQIASGTRRLDQRQREVLVFQAVAQAAI